MYTKEDLKIMQSWSLQKKIQVTQAKIIEWYQHYEGKVYVSFSGGKDSTVYIQI
jgi:predicted phosphoadenosine phosphosulfate sulfurtransferase